MAEPIAKKETCENCGADVRPDTQFCYGCGRSVAKTESVAEPDDSNDSLRDLEAALAATRVDETPKSKIESAAAERRKARVAQRKQVEVVWEPAGPRLSYFIAAAVIFLFVLLIVYLSRSVR